MHQLINSDVVRASVMKLLESYGTPRALSVAIALRYDEAALLQLETRPSDYLAAQDFGIDYMVTKLLSKWKGLRTSLDTRATALAGWMACEQRCHETNERLKRLRSGEHDNPVCSYANAVLFTASRKISRLLGKFDLSMALRDCQWGPGATADLSRRAGLDRKIRGPLTVTRRCLSLARDVLEADPHWAAVLLGIVPEGPFSILQESFKAIEWNKHLTVPKDAKTDRNICKEPTINGFLQQGYGKLLRRRLMRTGINLDDQSTNQKLAQVGSSYGLATLDLSNASDSVSFELVRDLLPPEWFDHAERLRAGFTKVGDKIIRLEKFSSMGNAFTFELETLIFWGIVSAVCELESVPGNLVWVYGDDIICPAEAVPRVLEVFSFFGFQVNTQKSYWEGPFRESCGKHYFEGEDVTPIYLKTTDASLQERVRMANRLVRFSMRTHGHWRDSRIRLAWKTLFESVPADRRPLIPMTDVSDDGFLVPPSFLGKHCPNHGYDCLTYVFVPKIRRAVDSALLAYKLRRPVFSNAHPRGWPFVDAQEGKWVYRRRYIHAVS